MFERFTERARQVVVLAQDEARSLRHNYLGTEHILLALLREEEDVAARVLASFGITLEDARARVIGIVGQGDEITTGQIPFTERAKRVLDLALREALSLGHNYIGVEHILLGLVRQNDSLAAKILLNFDADAEKVRDAVIRTLGASGPRQTGEGFLPGEGSGVELVLRRVVPVAQQFQGGTWIVSVEVWDHGLIVRWAGSLGLPRNHPDRGDWLVSDDIGTSYVGHDGIGTGSPRRGFHYSAEFEPAPPAEATSLLIRLKPTDEELSISLAD